MEFHELLQMWGLILSNPVVCLEYFAVQLIVIVGGYF